MAEGNVKPEWRRISSFVLVNVQDFDDGYLSDYLEAVVLPEDVNVHSLTPHPGIPDRVLVKLDGEIDLDVAQDTVHQEPLEGQCLRLEPAEKMNAVITEGNHLLTSSLKHYFHEEFGNGCVSNCVQIPQCSEVAVLFTSAKVTRKVLKREILTPLPNKDYRVRVKPFLSNFHGRILHRGKSLLHFLEENPDSGDEILSKACPPTPKSFTDRELKNPLPGEPSPRIINFPLQKSHWHLLKDSLKSLNLTSIHYDVEKDVLAFQSVNSDAENDEEDIKDLVADVIESRVKLSESVSELFETKHGQTYLKGYLFTEWSEDTDVSVDVNDGVLICCGLDETKVEEAKRKVMTDLFTLVEVDNKSLSVDVLENLKMSLEGKFKVHISWNEESATKIRITGVKDDVSCVRDCIQTMTDDSTTSTSHIEFSVDKSAYILEHCQDEIDEILKNVEPSKDSADGKLTISYSGKLKEVEKVSAALDNIRTTLESEEIDAANEFPTDEANLITKELSLLSPDSSFQNSHDLFMAKHKCLILNNFVEESDTQSSSSVLPTKSQKKDVGTHKSFVSKKATFRLNSGIQLKIKDNGNITRERSDVLVCVLDESRQLTKTNVSKAFLGIEKGLQNTVDALSFSSNGVGLAPCHARKGKIKCKAIVFVSLLPFKRGIREDYLRKIILEVLTKAAEFKAESVSFPSIGSGKVLKYPEDVISKQFSAAVKEFVDDHAGRHRLRQIKLLACNRGLFYSLKKRVEKWLAKATENKDRREEEDGREKRERKDQDPDGDDDDFLAKNFEIRIIHRLSNSLAPCWKSELKNYVNHHDKVETQLKSLPKSLDQKIKAKVKTTPVLVTTDTSTSGHCVLKLKGSKDHVLQMKFYITEKIAKESRGHPQKPLPTAAPNRGTVAFMKYKAALEVTVPPYWKRREGVKSSLEKVSDKTRQGIEKLLLTTWDSANVGVGNDAQGILPSSKIEFVSVERIEKPARYKVYASSRNEILQKRARRGKISKSIDEVSLNSNPVWTYGKLPDFMREELCSEVNEHYLFHGTKKEIVDPIIKQGFCPNIANPSAMFGKGVYAAESSTKADQYTDDPQSRLPPGSIHTMFLVRMLQGDVFRCTKQHPSISGKNPDKLVRPPCKKCYKDKCTCGTENYDSVMGDKDWLFREFVVYQQSQCYPEYVIKYKRI